MQERKYQPKRKVALFGNYQRQGTSITRFSSSSLQFSDKEAKNQTSRKLPKIIAFNPHASQQKSQTLK